MEEISELMKDLTYDFAGDIVNLLLPSTKLNDRNTDFFEPIILGMFLVGYAYYFNKASTLTKGEKGTQINNFHHVMHNSIINEICIGLYKINNAEEIHNFSDHFGIILDKRFLDYFPLIDPEITSDYFQLSESFAEHFFREKLQKNELESFVSHLNITIALHLARMKEKLM